MLRTVCCTLGGTHTGPALDTSPQGDAAPDAAPDAASDAVSEAALCAVSITLVLPGHNDPSSPTHCHVSVTPILSRAELASKTSELIAELAAAQAASARTSAALAVSSAPEVTDAQAASSSTAPEVSTLCTDAQTSPSRTAPPEGLPPTEAKKPTTAPRLAGILGRAGGPDLERKIAEIKANHAATVMQKLHRDASKREVCKSLQARDTLPPMHACTHALMQAPRLHPPPPRLHALIDTPPLRPPLPALSPRHACLLCLSLSLTPPSPPVRAGRALQALPGAAHVLPPLRLHLHRWLLARLPQLQEPIHRRCPQRACVGRRQREGC